MSSVQRQDGAEMWVKEHFRSLFVAVLIVAAILFSAVTLSDDASASSEDRSGMKVSIIGDSLSDGKAYVEVFPDSGSDRIGARLAYVMDSLLPEDDSDQSVWKIVAVIMVILAAASAFYYFIK